MRNRFFILIIISLIFVFSMTAVAEVDEDIAVVQKVITTHSGNRNNPYSIYYPIQLEKPGLISVHIRPVNPELPFNTEDPGSRPNFYMSIISQNVFGNMNDDDWNDWLNDIDGSVPRTGKTVDHKHIYRSVIIRDTPRQINYPVDAPEISRTNGKYIIWIRGLVRPTVESILIIRYPGSRHYFDPNVDRYRRKKPDLVVDNIILDDNNKLKVQIKNISQATINGGYWRLQGKKAVTLIADIEGRKYGITLPDFDPEMKLREYNQPVSYTFDRVNINDETEVKVTIDNSDIMIEENKDNNEKIIKIGGTGQEGGFKIESPQIPLNTSLKIKSSDTKPDLEIKRISLNDQNEIVIELQNVDGGNIKENLWNESNVILHLKKDDISWANIYKSGFDPDNKLINSGSSVIFNTGFKLNQNTKIKASIDESDVIDEVDENNNVMEVSLQP